MSWDLSRWQKHAPNDLSELKLLRYLLHLRRHRWLQSFLSAPILQCALRSCLKLSAEDGYKTKRVTYFAMGSGVTPNHASSVIQTPLSYLSQILKRWNQYLYRIKTRSTEGRKERVKLYTFVDDQEIDQHLAIDGYRPLLVHRPSCLQSPLSKNRYPSRALVIRYTPSRFPENKSLLAERNDLFSGGGLMDLWRAQDLEALEKQLQYTLPLLD